MLKKIFATTLCLMMFSTVVSAGETGTAELKLSAIEAEIIAKTNAERERFGYKPLKISVRLMKSARRHATWMGSNGSLSHTNDPVAENIAWGQTSPAEAMDSWMNSSGHRANILTRSYSRIGVAAFRHYDGQIYWCQQFLD